MFVFLIIADCNAVRFLVKIDEFDNVGVVDSSPFDEETVVIGELFFIAGVKLVSIDELVCDDIFVGGSTDLRPVFG